MKFMISRVSAECEQSPCEGAVKETYNDIDERDVDSPDKLLGYDREHWYKEGFNHRIENNHIKRYFKCEAWFIKINTLEELITFAQKCGEDIIIDTDEDKDIPKLIIYDDYIE